VLVPCLIRVRCRARCRRLGGSCSRWCRVALCPQAPTFALFDVVSAIEPFAAGRCPSAWRREAILLGVRGTGKDAASSQTEEQKGNNSICGELAFQMTSAGIFVDFLAGMSRSHFEHNVGS
jgi:hypothetical protein